MASPSPSDRHCDVVVVGSGPAGISTALHLVQHDPAWARRVLVVEKAVHPRKKLCSGAVSHHGRAILYDLGLALEDRVRNFEVDDLELAYRDRSYSFRGKPIVRVVRRAEFDHWLVREAEARGVEVLQGEAVLDARANDLSVEVSTEQRTIHAGVLVVAEGAGGRVRKALGMPLAERNIARMLEVLSPEDPQHEAHFVAGRMRIDFSRMTDGVQGYYWDIPTQVDGAPFMSRGLFDSRIRGERPRADLKSMLADFLGRRERARSMAELHGNPYHRFDPRAEFARQRVLLAGESAGVDPLFGEGIAFALGYGKHAARAIVSAFERDDFSFREYRALLFTDPLFRQLRLRHRLARIAYRMQASWFVRFCWSLARFGVRFTPFRRSAYDPAARRSH